MTLIFWFYLALTITEIGLMILSQLKKPLRENVTMGQKEDAVALAKQNILAGQDEALSDGLGAIYDQGKSDGSPVEGGGGGFSQADIDAAVQAKADADAADMASFKASADAALAGVQASLDDVTGKLVKDEKLIEDAKEAADELQAMVDAIHAKFPAVPPVEEQPPVEQPPVEQPPVEEPAPIEPVPVQE